MQHLEVPTDMDGARLDRILARAVPEWSRSRLQAVVRAGGVKIDGEVITKPGLPVAGGTQIEVELPETAPSVTPAGDAITELDVIWEDEHFAAINKPPGLLSHPNTHSLRSSLVQLAEARYGTLPEADQPGRPGIVHRLDRLTSGVMMIARTPEAMLAIKEQFMARTVAKTYIGVAHHVPEFETFWEDSPLEKDPARPERMRIAREGEGREASTLFETVERFRSYCILVAKPHTGRTHQIRVHAKHQGLPLVGDKHYPHPGALSDPLPNAAPQLHRHALHAWKLEVDHPVSGERLEFVAPIPDDLQSLMDWLRENRPVK